MTIALTRRLFTTDEYDRMIESGILTKADRVELIRGEIFAMSPVGPRHAAIVNRLTRLIGRYLQERAIVSVQNPIRLSDHSEPEPDVALLHNRPDFYEQAHPEPEDVFLAIEVADSTRSYDVEVKADLYAEAGIQELWILDVAAKEVLVYRQPTASGYAIVKTHGHGDSLVLLAFPDIRLDSRGFF
ncbi:MAG: Uma2 family endonuclease [Chloroflexota bacterium]